MTQKISLVPYSVRIREKQSKEFLVLDSFQARKNQIDFIDFFNSYLAGRKTQNHVDKDRKMALEVHRHRKDKRTITGTFKAGSFGYEAELKNVETGETKTRETDDCEMLPFYFRLEHKVGQDSGILLLQRFGIHGVKSGLLSDLAEQIKKIDGNLVIEVNPLVTSQEIEKIIGCGLKKIRYLRYTVPADTAEDLDMSDNQIEHCQMETVIKAKRNRFMAIPSWITDIATNKAPAGNLIEVKGVEYDDVKIVISDNGQERTLSLSDVSKFRMSIDVTGDVTMDKESGHPTFASIDVAANGILPEIRTAVGWNDVK